MRNYPEFLNEGWNYDNAPVDISDDSYCFDSAVSAGETVMNTYIMDVYKSASDVFHKRFYDEWVLSVPGHRLRGKVHSKNYDL